MKILRVFPKRTSLTPTDPLAFVGGPPLDAFRPEADEVHVSVTFSWDLPEGRRLMKEWGRFYPVVRIGGPALGSPAGPFEPGLYIKKGITFTTRGCNRRCPWCLVPGREGRLKEVAEFAEGHVVQDNNLLQAKPAHILRVFDMLRRQRRAAVFAGGIQASLVTPWFAEQLRSIRVGSIFLAADTAGALAPLAQALDILSFLGRKKLRVYTLIGFNGETIPEAEERLERVWALGGLPFAQLYQPEDRHLLWPRAWRALAKKWSRPAAMVAAHSAPKKKCPEILDLQPRLFIA